MRSIEGQAVGFNYFYCDECKQEHARHIAVEHPHYSEQFMRDYQKRKKEQEKISGG